MPLSVREVNYSAASLLMRYCEILQDAQQVLIETERNVTEKFLTLDIKMCLMKDPEWLQKFIRDREINARLIRTGKVSTVGEAAREMNCGREKIIKSMVLVSESGRAIVAVVNGTSRVNASKVEKILKERVRVAEREEVERLTGFQAGGVPPVGHGCLTLIDPEVFRSDPVYGGGGDEYHLIEISPDEIVRASSGGVLIGDIRT